MKIAHKLLISTLLLGAIPAFANADVIVAPTDGVVLLGTVPIAADNVIVLDPGEAVVLTHTPAMNVGLVDIVGWGTTAIGPAWIDARGMALYNYDLDPIGQSACNGVCAADWPPLRAKAGMKGVDEWTVVARNDGTWQWAFRGHPLYTFVNDTVPGQVTGDGVSGFHLAD